MAMDDGTVPATGDPFWSWGTQRSHHLSCWSGRCFNHTRWTLPKFYLP